MILDIVKQIPEALYNVLFFKSVTNMPRWMEIGCGFLAWGNVVVIAYAIFH